MKKWLTDNKIYIELVSSILIGAAALMVAYASYTVSEQQLLLTEISLQPHFHIEITYKFDSKKGKYVDNELYVINSGAPVNNTTVAVKTFIIVDHEFKKQRLKTYIPIIGYFTASFDHHVSSGKLATFSGHLNNENFYRLYNEFMSEEIKVKYGFVNIDIEHVVEVTYLDKKGVSDSAYFIDRKLVEKKDILEKLDQHQSNFTEIGGLTADQLMEEVAEFNGT